MCAGECQGCDWRQHESDRPFAVPDAGVFRMEAWYVHIAVLCIYIYIYRTRYEAPRVTCLMIGPARYNLILSDVQPHVALQSKVLLALSNDAAPTLSYYELRADPTRYQPISCWAYHAINGDRADPTMLSNDAVLTLPCYQMMQCRPYPSCYQGAKCSKTDHGMLRRVPADSKGLYKEDKVVFCNGMWRVYV